MKNIIITENELLLLALDRLKEATGIYGTFKLGKKDKDAPLVLTMPGRKDQIELIVEVKRTLGAATAAQMLPKKDRCILVTNYVNPNQAEKLKILGIPFIDCTGNAYLNIAPFFVLITGKKPDNNVTIQQPRLFKPGGLQIIFVILCNPDLINAPYRDIAVKAGVALGTVAWVMRDLRQQGYILDPGNKIRRLVKKEVLFNIWVTGFEQLLRPKLLVNRYHAENRDWWQEANIEDCLWGGEVAAYKMTGYLKPQGVTLYAPKLPDRLMLKHKLRLDAHGEIEILRPFWDFDYPEKKDALVPPLIVYADLMVQTDGRTTETAGMVYEQYLARYIKEN